MNVSADTVKSCREMVEPTTEHNTLFRVEKDRTTGRRDSVMSNMTSVECRTSLSECCEHSVESLGTSTEMGVVEVTKESETKGRLKNRLE